ncbi:MAG TPA: hypothetical protein VNX68_17085 [Nitrosopumilaceae archaeon]|nr:hypothetical protein [Nitrosopumilaceae archaeon]
MTIEQANKKLILARKKRDKINTEIMALHDFLIQKKKDAISIQEKRNKEIYTLYLRNNTIKEIAAYFKLSAERIRIICQHMEKQQKKEKIIAAWINRNSK